MVEREEEDMPMPKRYIPNPYRILDEIGESVNQDLFLQSIKAQLDKCKSRLEEGYAPSIRESINSMEEGAEDIGIYAGSGGNIIIWWKLYQWYLKNGQLAESQIALANSLVAFEINKSIIEGPNSINPRTVSFFFGSAGIYTMGAIIYSTLGNKTQRDSCMGKVLEVLPIALEAQTEDELLYGRTGYLYSLLLLTTHNPVIFNVEKEVLSLVQALYEFGLTETAQGELLIYHFPKASGKIYIGAAHGLVGVYYILLRSLQLYPRISEEIPELMPVLRNSCVRVAAKQSAKGNFGPSTQDSREILVHFCHGAPGAIPFLLLAYDYFGEEFFLRKALKAAELVWKRGILRKGNTLCHGLTGNVYPLFAVYRVTQDEKWRRRGLLMTQAAYDAGIQEICNNHVDFFRMKKGTPDTPYSLMEGLGGTIVFYVDILLGAEQMKFPGYEI